MPKRRGRGEGSIYKRKDGRWTASVTLPTGSDGKRRRRQVYGRTRELVAEELHKLQHAKRSGVSIEPGKLTLGQYLGDWIEDVAKPRIRASTLAEYQRHVDRVTEAAGGVVLQNWKPGDIRSLWSKFEKEGLGGRTRRAVHVTIRQALGDAVSDGLLLHNPTDAVTAPRQPTPTRRFLTPEQVRTLLESTDATQPPQTIALVTLIASTGMRIGEALGLRWEDVDLPAQEVRVTRTLAEVNGKFVEQEPKTKAGRRSITLPKRAAKRLRELRRSRGTVPLGTALVFHNQRGGWLRKSNLYQQVLHPLMVEAELPKIGWHALRHAHATALLAAGEPVADVAARLGHSDASLTMRVYAHAIPDRGKDIARRIDEILG